MTRSASKQDLVRSLGARPVVADALDPDAVAQAVASAEPEVIVHQLTALSGPMRMRDARHPDRSVAATMTNRLRTEATDHLLAAGRAVGARRFVAQSFAAFRFARTGGPVQTEADPLDPDPPAALRTALAAIVYLEQAVTTIEWGEGLVLRYGGFYGPGTGISLAPDAVMAAPIRKRRFPIVGDGGGVWSHRPHRGRRGGDRGRGRARPAGHLQRRRRRARARAGVAAGAGERAGRQATEACPTLARAAGWPVRRRPS